MLHFNIRGLPDLPLPKPSSARFDGSGTLAGGGIYTADVDADLDYDQADYDLLYDVVAGIQPHSALANRWRF